MNSDAVPNGAAQEIGCGHDFGVVYECIFCGRPRHLSTSEYVTRRFIEEHPDQLTPYSWPPPHDSRPGLIARIRALFR